MTKHRKHKGVHVRCAVCGHSVFYKFGENNVCPVCGSKQFIFPKTKKLGKTSVGG